MRNFLSKCNRRAVRKANRVPPRWRSSFEQLEDRVVPAGNLLVITAGSYPTQYFKEFTPSGALVRQLTVPPPIGSSGDTARDLVEDPGGNIYVYNGTFTPSLATWNPSTSAWTQQNYPGWGTVNNMSYGGLGLYQNYVFASDMTVAGDPEGRPTASSGSTSPPARPPDSPRAPTSSTSTWASTARSMR